MPNFVGNAKQRELIVQKHQPSDVAHASESKMHWF